MSTVLPPPPPPEKKDLWFEIPTKIILEKSEAQRAEDEKDDAGLVDEDSNEFGLTKRDYDYLLYDIELAIADFDREHGFDEHGFYDNGTRYYFLPRNSNPKISKKRQRKISAQDVAIKKGLIQIKTKEVDTK
jgi:hypothetical protein